MTDGLAAEADTDATDTDAAHAESGTDADVDAEAGTEATARERAQRVAARASAFGGGVVAAGLGLGALAAAVLPLWIASPFPDSGLGGALHVGAAMWLLAQGADLVRTQTLSGVPAPIGMTPLLLSVLPAWLLYRSAASAAAQRAGEDEGDAEDGAGGEVDVKAVAGAAGWLLAGYLTAAAVVVTYTASGLVHVDAVAAALYVPVFAGVAVAAGTWTGCGRPALADRIPYGADAVVALRAAGMAAGVLAGGGALLAGASIAGHAGAVGRTFVQLSGPMAGRLAVLLVAVALVPNMAVWAASYALGPGFAVGVGSVVAPAGASGYPMLPGFPLLAALPATGGPSAVGWATFALPVLAGGLAGWSVGRASSSAEGGAWSVVRTALVAAGAALLCGVALAVLAAWSGGPMGTATLADFGPAAWATGAAALAWLVLTAPPTALALHHFRTPRAAAEPRAESVRRWFLGLPVRLRLRLRLRPTRTLEAAVAEPETPAHAPGTVRGRLRRRLPRRRRALPDDGLGITPPDFDPLPWPTPPLPPPMPLTPPSPISPPPPETDPLPPRPSSDPKS